MDWIFVLFLSWAITTLAGLLLLLVVAIRENAITTDDLPPRLKKTVGLIAFCPGPIVLIYLLATQELQSVDFLTWAKAGASTAMFVLVLWPWKSFPRMTFDRRLTEKIRKK